MYKLRRQKGTEAHRFVHHLPDFSTVGLFTTARAKVMVSQYLLCVLLDHCTHWRVCASVQVLGTLFLAVSSKLSHGLFFLFFAADLARPSRGFLAPAWSLPSELDSRRTGVVDASGCLRSTTTGLASAPLLVSRGDFWLSYSVSLPEGMEKRVSGVRKPILSEKFRRLGLGEGRRMVWWNIGRVWTGSRVRPKFPRRFLGWWSSAER